jgi:entry exclusion lipoprotein TrbK
MPCGAFLLAFLILAGCTSQTPDQDLAQCRVELIKLVRPIDEQQKRFWFIHDCMMGKGWKPSPECTTNNVEGTWICKYTQG